MGFIEDDAVSVHYAVDGNTVVHVRLNQTNYRGIYCAFRPPPPPPMAFIFPLLDNDPAAGCKAKKSTKGFLPIFLPRV